MPKKRGMTTFRGETKHRIVRFDAFLRAFSQIYLGHYCSICSVKIEMQRTPCRQRPCSVAERALSAGSNKITSQSAIQKKKGEAAASPRIKLLLYCNV